ncbi:hypothetical protein CBL_20009 [Carabus blaptoides fortunei]
MDVTIIIDNTSIKHRALLAEVEDELILGMEVMTRHGFKLVLEKGVKKINEEEFAQLEGSFSEGIIVMLEPKNVDVKNGIRIVGKSLIKATQLIPVRIMSVHFYRIVLKRGQSEEIPGTLVNQISPSSQELTADQRTKAKNLIGKFQYMFQFNEISKGRTNVVLHKIDTDDARPIRQPARRLPLAKREEAERIIEDMKMEVVDDKWQPDGLRRDQENDPTLKIILKWKAKESRPVWEDVAPHSHRVKSYWAQCNSMVVEDDLLKLVLDNADGTEKKTQLVIPKSRSETDDGNKYNVVVMDYFTSGLKPIHYPTRKPSHKLLPGKKF